MNPKEHKYDRELNEKHGRNFVVVYGGRNSAPCTSTHAPLRAPPKDSRHNLDGLLEELHDLVIDPHFDGSLRTNGSAHWGPVRHFKIALLGFRLKHAPDERTFRRHARLLKRAVVPDGRNEAQYSTELAHDLSSFAANGAPAAHWAEGLGTIYLPVQQIIDPLKDTESLKKRHDTIEGESPLTAKTSQNFERIQGLLEQAEQLANIGSWELDIEKQAFIGSEHLYRMLGVDPKAEPITFARGIEMIHPDDRHRAIRDIDALSKHGRPFDNELRFVTTAGSVRIFHTRAVPITNEAGRVVIARGMSRDITVPKAAEERLRVREALLTHAEQIANFGSWDHDLRTKKAAMSDQLRRIYGIAADVEWTSKDYWARCHPMDRERVRQIGDKALAECKPFEYVLRYISPDGRVRTHLTRIVPIPGEDGKVARMIGVLQDITDQKLVEDDHRRLSQQLMRTRDEERRNMARNLHESAGQSLAALKMTLGRLRDALPPKNKLAHSLLQSSIDLAEGAIREVRTVSYVMHPPLLDEAGLGPALRWYAKGFSERSGIQVSVDVPANFARQSQEIETTVFRIVQEALTNVHRYSGSRTAQITLTRANGQVWAEIRDNGCGLDVPNLNPNRQSAMGVGIAGMRERVQELQGKFQLESVPGKGTTVRAILPDSAQIVERFTDRAKAKIHEGKQRRRATQSAW